MTYIHTTEKLLQSTSAVFFQFQLNSPVLTANPLNSPSFRLFSSNPLKASMSNYNCFKVTRSLLKPFNSLFEFLSSDNKVLLKLSHYLSFKLCNPPLHNALCSTTKVPPSFFSSEDIIRAAPAPRNAQETDILSKVYLALKTTIQVSSPTDLSFRILSTI